MYHEKVFYWSNAHRMNRARVLRVDSMYNDSHDEAKVKI